MARHGLIDGNSWGHACNHATKLKSGDMETQAVFGFLQRLRNVVANEPGRTFQVLWDGRAQWRFDLHPDYKSNRANDPKKIAAKESYAKQKPYLVRALRALGVRQLTVATHEADDMAGYLVDRLAADPANDINLYTGDHDWLQLIRLNVEWHDSLDRKNVIRARNFFDKTGYKTPFNFLEGKCLQGDSSDVVPGVGGIGEKGAPEFVAEFGSVRRFWQAVDTGAFVPTKKAHQRLASEEGRAIFRKNFRLMQLLRVQKPDPSAVQVDRGACDKDAFQDVCFELGFTSIANNVDHFTRPFIGAQ